MQHNTIPAPDPDDRDLEVHRDHFNAINLLRALALHLETYPALSDTLTNVHVHEAGILVYPWHGAGHLNVLNQWAATLTDRSDVRATMIHADGRVHLELSGHLVTGVTITAVVLVSSDEAATRLDHASLERGARFPIGVLEQAVAPTEAVA